MICENCGCSHFDLGAMYWLCSDCGACGDRI